MAQLAFDDLPPEIASGVIQLARKRAGRAAEDEEELMFAALEVLDDLGRSFGVIDSEKKKLAVRLNAESGQTLEAIGARLGLTGQAVWQWINRKPKSGADARKVDKPGLSVEQAAHRLGTTPPRMNRAIREAIARREQPDWFNLVDVGGARGYVRRIPEEQLPAWRSMLNLD